VLPDRAVDVGSLLRGLAVHATTSGVRTVRDNVTLSRQGGSGSITRAGEKQHDDVDVVVVCAGAATSRLLTSLDVAHPLATMYLPYGRIATPERFGLTYWLDDDLLALSPDPDGVQVALPGRLTSPESQPAAAGRLVQSVSRHWPGLPIHNLTVQCGVVCEPVGSTPDTLAHVVDLRRPPDGWGRLDNTVICLPGKWTTAWHAADGVARALRRA
jgi:hypothetical protein